MARAAQQNDRRNDDSRALVVQPPRLPYPAQARELDMVEGQWKALVDAVYPSAKTVDGVMLAVRYCKERNLDVFKKPVHVVPMWNSALNREVETVWPGINDYRTTAARTGSWAGNDDTRFGPTLRESFKEEEERTKWNNGQREKYKAKAECPAFDFPEWAQVTVYRMVSGQRVAFVGPKVYFKEVFSGEKGLRVPNARWRQAPFQMIEKCAEAAALRRAFPEELGNEYTAEEMSGKAMAGDPIAAAKEHHQGSGGPEPQEEQRPTRDSVRGWNDAVQAELDDIQRKIDAPASTLEGITAAKKHFVELYANDWPEAALVELETRFDVGIANLSRDDGDQQQEEGEEADDEQTTN